MERSLGRDNEDTHDHSEGSDARPKGREPEFRGEGRLRPSPPSNLDDHRRLALPVRPHYPDVEGDPAQYRLYSACFHSAQVALYARGSPVARLGSETSRPGTGSTRDVPRELGGSLNDMQTYRRRVYYGSGGVERDAEDLLQQTAAFLDAMGRVTGRDATTE